MPKTQDGCEIHWECCLCHRVYLNSAEDFKIITNFGSCCANCYIIKLDNTIQEIARNTIKLSNNRKWDGPR